VAGKDPEPASGDEDLPPYDPTAAFVCDLPSAEIEETARHAGHLDIARELPDGQTRLGPR
jgi:hypothetical protein